jgi:hypothetical protein
MIAISPSSCALFTASHLLPDRVFFCIPLPVFPIPYPILSVKLHYLKKENGVWKSKVGIDNKMAEI